MNTLDTSVENSPNSQETIPTVLNADTTIQKPEGQHYSVKSPSRGGARPGAGRPKGSTALITAATLLKAIEDKASQPFEELLAEGYYDTIVNNDKKTRLEYERMFLGKVVAEKVEVNVNESEDAVEAKKQAFTEALAALTGIQSINKE
jgi:hypothetical protein